MKWNLLWCTIWIMAAVAGSAQAGEFSLSSPQLRPGGPMGTEQLYNGFGCRGGNMSPALSWQNSPKNTRSYALMVHDPDAPTGSGWWHWVIFNIPGETTALALNAGNIESGRAPSGSVQSRTDFGTRGYGGGCPPPGSGEHHYIFTLYALDIDRLELDENVSAAMVGFFVRQHSIGSAELTALYKRE